MSDNETMTAPDGATLRITDAPDAMPLSDTEYAQRKPKAPRKKPDGSRVGSNSGLKHKIPPPPPPSRNAGTSSSKH